MTTQQTQQTQHILHLSRSFSATNATHYIYIVLRCCGDLLRQMFSNKKSQFVALKNKKP